MNQDCGYSLKQWAERVLFAYSVFVVEKSLEGLSKGQRVTVNKKRI
jgi:hypothetical protein